MSPIVLAVKDNDLGTIIGEPCGKSASFHYGEIKSSKLPNTAMRFRHSTGIFKRTNHFAQDSTKPIEPDILIPETINDFIKR